MKTFLSIAAGISAAIALASPAAARDDSATRVVDVSDLDPQADGDEIERRVARAARRVCGTGGSRTIAANMHVQTCRAEAVERALAR